MRLSAWPAIRCGNLTEPQQPSPDQGSSNPDAGTRHHECRRIISQGTASCLEGRSVNSVSFLGHAFPISSRLICAWKRFFAPRGVGPSALRGRQTPRQPMKTVAHGATSSCRDDYKFPPLEAVSLLGETTQSVLKNGSRACSPFFLQSFGAS